MRRRDVIFALAGTAAWPFSARAQQPWKPIRIGFLANDPTIPAQSAFVAALAETGFVEGENVVIERRFAGTSWARSAELAAELVRLEVNLIVASGDNNVIAAKQATTAIPIVMVNVVDPIARGIVTSLASPGGNITGVASHVSAEMAGKRLDLLREAVPRISRLAVLGGRATPQDLAQWNVIEPAARALNIALQDIAVREPGELENGLNQIRRDRPDALFGLYNGPTLMFRKRIADFAAEQRLPAMYAFIETAEAGGLMSYGASRTELFRHAAGYASRILRGAKPADLPIEQPSKFKFVINLKAAKALGLEIPATLIARADEVIE
jgi:putative tryptophan/tyrosine transport system substrate-binding protein